MTINMNKELQQKFIDAGKKLWEDEGLREKFGDASGKVDKMKLTGAAKKVVVVAKDLYKDVSSGEWKLEPVWKWFLMLGATAYAISPLDFIPDFIPVVGLTDDAAILVLVAGICFEEINKYVDWKYSGDDAINNKVKEEEIPDDVVEGDWREVDSTTPKEDIDDLFNNLKNSVK